MFHFWQNNTTLPQENLTEPALYAVALTEGIRVLSDGICPQGQYPTSPLSTSECAEAKQGSGIAGTTVRNLTGIITSVLSGSGASSSLMHHRANSTRGNPVGNNAGGTRSVAYLLTGKSLLGNDTGLNESSISGSRREARAMTATAIRSASFVAAIGTSYKSDSRISQG